MILFLIRRFNDIDHSTPIIYKLAQQGYKNVVVLALNPNMDLKNDFRLNYLRTRLNIRVDYLYNYYKPKFTHKLASFLVCNLKFLSFAPSSFLLRIFNFNNYFYNKLFGIEWCNSLIKNKKIKISVFDWQKPGKFNTLDLIKASKQNNIPVVAVPHGLNFNINKVWTTTAQEKGLKTQNFGENWKLFDKIIVQHEHYRNMVIDSGVNANKLEMLGSARFCKEWENIYFNILPEVDSFYLNKDDSKVNIVYMDHSPVFRLNTEQIVGTIKRLSQLEYVNIVVKPSTGSKESLSSQELYNYARVDHVTSSVSLINWSDMVIGNQSSIMLDALIMNKILVCPSYFSKNLTLFNSRNVSVDCKNYSELLNLIKSVKENPDFCPYDKINVDSFIKDIVYGGDENRDVLKDHANFILSKIKNK